MKIGWDKDGPEKSTTGVLGLLPVTQRPTKEPSLIEALQLFIAYEENTSTPLAPPTKKEARIVHPKNFWDLVAIGDF